MILKTVTIESKGGRGGVNTIRDGSLTSGQIYREGVMKKGRVTGWTGRWGKIETEDGEIIWVGYTDIDDPPNDKGYYDLIDGSKVTLKL